MSEYESEDSEAESIINMVEEGESLAEEESEEKIVRKDYRK